MQWPCVSVAGIGCTLAATIVASPILPTLMCTVAAGRDPRWGRNQETNGESPALLSDYGKAYTEGLQLGEDSRFLKTVVTLKHWDAYELENYGNYTRHNFNAIVSPFMFSSTYLVPFQATVTNPKSPAAGVM